MLDEYKLDLKIICIDFKSFYATVECNERNLDPLKTALIVADDSRGNGAISLAASPYAKSKYKIGSRCRLFEIEKNILSKIIVARPSMKKYVDVSSSIIEIYLKYFSRNDIFIYSIDECFIDVTNYLKLYKMNARQLALKIMKEIYDTTKIYSTCGIGPNMLIAKYALDIESKHNDDWVAQWTYSDIKTKLYKITNIRSLWGIGRGMEKNLRNLGVINVEDINNLGVKFLYEKFGIMGEELYLHVNGIDISRIQDQSIIRTRKSFSIGQTLFKELYNDEILTVLMEMTYEQVLKMRQSKLKTKVISISIGYNRSSNLSVGSKRKKLMDCTSEFVKISTIVKHLFNEIYINNMPARSLSISLGDLVEKDYEQLDLFSNKKRDDCKLEDAVIEIRRKYGNSSIMLALSERNEATQKMRNKLIGGHNAQN